ncbi:transporter substrate-binding domain-containing protein [Roseovarius sp. M141]|uniref:transporter substrate-binding domain-containing protein n=1 Tax=Roseovarius sp. M141 TaxID=2583806 RepID=UPI0020CE8CE5|nr:transporter substrate-binding domain-containing protein [Roseovarius sp. M141]MCQ0093759.1 transporter substrate-binding domain-containing protein [Roseovarius sp. M141]
MNLRTMLATATAAALLTAGAATAETVKIGIASEPYPPFAAPDSAGNWSGWEVEIANAICAVQEMTCEITPTGWDGIIPSLLGEQIDVIMASMSITEERAKKIDFTDHYYKTPAVVVTAKGSGITPDGAGLDGKILGVQASTTHQAYVQKHFSDSAAEIRVYQTQDEANQDLYSGRVDAVQADSIAMADFVNSDIGACCEIVGAVADDEAILGKGVGAGVRKGDDALREQLNAGIAAILENGTYDEITDKYFTTTIYSK